MAANKYVKLTVYNDNADIVKQVIITTEEHEKFLTKVAEMEFPTHTDETRLPYEEYLLESASGVLHTLHITPFTWSKAEEVTKL